MPLVEIKGEQINLDDEGYLVHGEAWNEKVAAALAEREGVGQLNDKALEMIKFMRDYYQRFNSFPILDSVCHNIHEPHNCVNEQFIDPLKAWKIAGLPEPGPEVVSYLRR